MHDDVHWMREALAEARLAYEKDEVPVGAVVVLGGKVVGRGHNRTVETGRPFEHAEIVALWEAVGAVGERALGEAVLYSTVEPCVMCTGAAILARVPKVVYGAREPRTGACESVFTIPFESSLDHRMAVIGGVEEDRCRELMRRFFAERREES